MNEKKLPCPFGGNISNVITANPKAASNVSVNEASAQLQGYRSRFNIEHVKLSYQSRQQNQQTNLRNPHSRQPHSSFVHRQHQQNPNYSNRTKANATNEAKTNTTYQRMQSFWCETCEQKFRAPEHLQRHIDEHEKCFIDGCKYEANKMLLQNHIEMQHDSGLFQRIGRIESDEDIEKWRAERRKRFPTLVNIQLRQLAQEARMERGERLSASQSRFGRKNHERDTRERNRDRPMKRSRPTSSTNGKKRIRKRPNKCAGKDGDDGEPKKMDAEKPLACAEEPEPKPNALAALCMYASDTDEEDGADADEAPTEVPNKEICPSVAEPEQINQSIATADSDDEPPDEKPIEYKTDFVYPEPKVSLEVEAKTTLTEQSSAPDTKPIEGNQRTKRRMQPSKELPKRKTLLNLTHKARRQNTLLEKLLENDIRHERNVLLQCVRFVVSNKYFGVGDSASSSTT